MIASTEPSSIQQTFRIAGRVEKDERSTLESIPLGVVVYHHLRDKSRFEQCASSKQHL